MKTSRMTYCLLAALSTLAAAQEPAPAEARVQTASRGKAIIITRDADGKEETKTIDLSDGGGEGGAIGGSVFLGAGEPGGPGAGAGAAIGGGATFGSAQMLDGEPGVRIRELAEPIRWNISGDAFEAPVRTGPVTFLGVSAIPVPHELAVHLPIAEDTGLGVEGVAPGSPAEKAGLQKSDVLMKLDDQILIHPRQLNVLVANHKEGESVKLTYLRKGEVKDATVTLGKRDVPPGEGKGDVLFRSFGGEAPLRTFTRRFEMPGQPAEDRVQDLQKHLQDVQEHLQRKAEDIRKDATAKADDVRERLDTKLQAEVRRAAEAAYSTEVQRAAEDELRRAKAAADAAEADTRKEIDELHHKLDAVLKLLEEKK